MYAAHQLTLSRSLHARRQIINLLRARERQLAAEPPEEEATRVPLMLPPGGPRARKGEREGREGKEGREGRSSRESRDSKERGGESKGESQEGESKGESKGEGKGESKKGERVKTPKKEKRRGKE